MIKGKIRTKRSTECDENRNRKKFKIALLHHLSPSALTNLLRTDANEYLRTRLIRKGSLLLRLLRRRKSLLSLVEDLNKLLCHTILLRGLRGEEVKKDLNTRKDPQRSLPTDLPKIGWGPKSLRRGNENPFRLNQPLVLESPLTPLKLRVSER